MKRVASSGGRAPLRGGSGDLTDAVASEHVGLVRIQHLLASEEPRGHQEGLGNRSVADSLMCCG